MNESLIRNWLALNYRWILTRYPEVVLLAVVPDEASSPKRYKPGEPHEPGEPGDPGDRLPSGNFLLEIGLVRWPRLGPRPYSFTVVDNGMQKAIPIRVVEVGAIVAAHTPTRLQRKGFPADGGWSVGSYFYPQAGTLGCAVSLEESAGVPAGFYSLICWHVVNFMKRRSPVVQPARVDMRSKHSRNRRKRKKYIVGHVWLWLLNELFDAALIKVSSDRERIAAGVHDEPIGNEAVQPLLGLPVCKIGRTTGRTEGTLGTTYACAKVGGYPAELADDSDEELQANGMRLFEAQIYATRPPAANSGMDAIKITKPGDSGSILLQQQGGVKSPVGLIFAESTLLDQPGSVNPHPTKEVTLANPLAALFGNWISGGPVEDGQPPLPQVFLKSFLS